VPARRAVIRWGWRLLRREWRQQLLMLALVTVAVAATVIGATVATNTPPPATAAFGTAQNLVTLPGASPQLAGQIATLRQHFGRVDVIENQTLAIPGSIDTYQLRAQNPHGPFGRPMLSLVSGRYPSGPGEVAVTSGLAADFHLHTGGGWQVGGATRTVTGIVQNPQNLEDEFALVAPGQVTHPDQVTVLFDGRGAAGAQAAIPTSISRHVQTPQSVAASNVINPETISLAAAVLGMLLIALVGVGGFTVLAQRRLRSIGMLGAQGATDAHIRLVVRANGAATGVVGAVAGFVLGLLAWLAYRPSLESSAHHVIGVFQLPWLVVLVAMALAVLATFFAASRPARAVARMPIVTALSGRPAPPKQVRRWAVPAGVVLLVGGFILLGIAGAQVGAAAGIAGGGNGNADLPQLVFGLLAIAVAVVLVAPACLAILARLGGRAPIPVRLALRDLARYRARSGSALGAVSISVLIAAIVIVVCAARFGNVLDYAGPNLTSSQLIVYAASSGPGGQPGPGGQGGPAGQGAPAGQGGPGQQTISRSTSSQAASARAIAGALGSRQVTTLELANATLRHAAAGRNWDGPLYVATPQLLSAFGIRASAFSPDADILSMRPGLDTMSGMQLLYGRKAQPPAQGVNGYPCPAGGCLANPGIEAASTLPSGTSAPNTVITEHAMRALGLTSSTDGWFIQAPRPLTSSQIYNARQTAATAGMTIETQNSVPSLSQITNVATVFAIALVLGILAMSVGLIRSETASDLRTLTATGAGSTIRRGLTATTAGALALAGAVAGLICGYVTAIGFFRTNQLDGLSALGSIPVANLLLILVGMPLAAAAGGWLLAGREPAGLARQPAE
jgi:putative ABC transport system permease protein